MKEFIPALLFFFAVCLFGCGKQDETNPVLTMKGKNPDTLIVKTATSYNDAGCTAQDDIDGDITSKIIVSTNVNVNIASNYQISYNAQDKAGNVSDELVRVVQVIKATGTYVTSSCSTDTLNITSNGSNDILTISGINGIATNITAQLNGTSFIISSQEILVGVFVTGTITTSGTTITLNFTLTTGGSPTTCTAELRRI